MSESAKRLRKSVENPIETLDESVADGTRMTWPPAARVTTERTDQKGD